MAALRVLLLTSEYPPYLWGGLGRYSAEAVAALRTSATVDVLNVPAYAGLFESERADGDGMWTAQEDGGRVVHAESLAEPGLYERWMAGGDGFAERARAAAARLDPPYDVAYVQDYYSGPYAVGLLFDRVVRRIVFMCHLPVYAGFTYFTKPHADEVHQAFEASSLRFADLVIAPSEFARRVLTLTHAIDPRRIAVLGEGVRLAEHPRVPSGPRGPLRILVVARMVEQKGLHFTVDVLRRLAEAGVGYRCTLVGRGPYTSAILGLVHEARIAETVDHVPQMAHDALLESYLDADMLLTTSLYETFGLVVLEAMSRGCVPVAFRLPALGELIGDAGVMLPVGATAAMADEIASLAADRGRLRRLSELGFERARPYSWERHAAALRRLLAASS